MSSLRSQFPPSWVYLIKGGKGNSQILDKTKVKRNGEGGMSSLRSQFPPSWVYLIKRREENSQILDKTQVKRERRGWDARAARWGRSPLRGSLATLGRADLGCSPKSVEPSSSWVRTPPKGLFKQRKKGKSQIVDKSKVIERRGWDSNPRSQFTRDNCLAGSPVRPLQHLSIYCRGGDSNPYKQMLTSTSSLRVYQFHHPGLYSTNACS
jgi:hypothetical protein